MRQWDHHSVRRLGLGTIPKWWLLLFLVLCPPHPSRSWGGASTGDSLGHRGQHTLPHHSPPSTLSPGAENHGRTFFPVFLNRSILLYFLAHALSCVHGSHGLLHLSLSLSACWCPESLGVNLWSVSTECVGIHGMPSTHQPPRRLHLIFLIFIPHLLMFFPNLILSCMGVVNNLKLFLEQAG